MKLLEICGIVLGICLFCFPAHAQPDVSGRPADQLATNRQPEDLPAAGTDQPSHMFSLTSRWKGMVFPGSHFYPAYLADPFSPATALNAAKYSESQIPHTGDSRYIFRIGGRFGLLRISPSARFDRGFQLNLHGAFLGMFDRKHSLDNVGWDGLYGINLNWRGASGMALKLGINHDSSHVGDEYAERTGARRTEYTRQEYVAGMSFPFWGHLRVYAEAGWAFDLRNEALQDRWRFQGGLEFKDDKAFWNGQMGYYAAADIVSFEESDWEPDVTLQAGLVIPVERINRSFRTGVEYRNGRSLIGEFSRYEETYWLWGIWIDL